MCSSSRVAVRSKPELSRPLTRHVYMRKLVDVRGFEPLTLALQTRCSPS